MTDADLRERCKQFYRKLGRDRMLRQGDPVEDIATFVQTEIVAARNGELVELTQQEVYAIAQQEAWNQGQERSIDYSMISWLENNGVVFARRGSGRTTQGE